MISNSKIILFAVIAILVTWTVYSYRQKSYGISMIKAGNIEELAKTVDGKPRLSTQLLGDAFETNKIEMFEMLLRKGGNINTAQLRTQWGPYPLLHHLSRYGEPSWLKVAFENGGDPSRVGRNGITPLLETIHGKRPENALVAIDAGADIHRRLKNEESYFDVAVHHIQMDVAYRLLEKGIDFNAGTYSEFASGIYRLQNMDKVGWTGAREEELKALEWHSKIVEWFRQRDLDIMNATYPSSAQDDLEAEKQGMRQIKKWIIPPIPREP